MYPSIRRAARGLAAASPLLAPLAARAGVVARAAEAPSDASAAWHLLGVLGPGLLWGLPLAYVVFTVAARMPRHPPAQAELDPPRAATFLDRLSLGADPRDGW